MLALRRTCLSECSTHRKQAVTLCRLCVVCYLYVERNSFEFAATNVVKLEPVLVYRGRLAQAMGTSSQFQQQPPPQQQQQFVQQPQYQTPFDQGVQGVHQVSKLSSSAFSCARGICSEKMPVSSFMRVNPRAGFCFGPAVLTAGGTLYTSQRLPTILAWVWAAQTS